MSFERVRGQAPAVEALRAALAGERLAHAYLLTGPDGVGKRTLARELAKAVLCAGKKGDSCDACPSCRAVDSGDSYEYDVMQVEEGRGREREPQPEDTYQDVSRKKNRTTRPVNDSDREIKIASVRILEQSLRLKPSPGRFWVRLVPRAERMNEESQNALLKTLEEPPGPRLLILTTSRPDALLPTVVSRLARVRLRRLSAKEVAAYLVEEEGMKRTEAGELAAVSGGSIGAALGASLEEVRAARAFVAKRLTAPARGTELDLGESMMGFAREQSSGGRGLEPVRRGLLALCGAAAAVHRGALWRSLGAPDPAGTAAGESGTEGLAALGSEAVRRRLEALLSAERAISGYASPDIVCRVLAGRLTSG